MRNIEKLPEPQVLVENKGAWKATLEENSSPYNKTRYRHADIKETLIKETHSKCVYCESKIGHNCPGDIEHKIPKSQIIDMIFEWNNMTIACNECNRRKGDYYDPNCMFLDPNTDDVENLVQHVGPMVFSKPGCQRSELTVRMLEINSINARKQLIARKIERLESVKNLVERIADEQKFELKDFLLGDLWQSCEVSSEFSGMIKAYVEGLPIQFRPADC